MPDTPRPRDRRRLAALPLAACIVALASLASVGCVGHRLYNDEPHEYLRTLEVAPGEGARTAGDVPPADLAVVEFDEHGILWTRDQLDGAIELIRRRADEAKRGVLVVVFVHGWQNNADPERTKGSFVEFRRMLREAARRQHETPGRTADRVVGVYLGWRGDTSDVPLHDTLTFLNRRDAAERVASLQMVEATYRILQAANRPGSKCFLLGHSLGGMVVGRTVAPMITTLLLDGGGRGVRIPADLVILQNPAMDGLSAWQLVDFLKRTGARVELRGPDGEAAPADGPVIVSITSEVDRALGISYRLGQSVGSMFTTFRGDHRPGDPSQRTLATTAHGLVDELVSHRASVVDGEVVLERVPGAYNDTPFWIIRVSPEISREHGDIGNPRYEALVEQLVRLNRGYEAGVQTWLRTTAGE